MNAYELANNLENKDRLWAIDENLLLNTCEMLRQLADRIAELEKQQSAEPVVWMSPDSKFSKTEGKLFYIPLYTTPQIKELSDEEINLKWWISSFEHLKALGGGISNEMETKLKDMKERLKKASER